MMGISAIMFFTATCHLAINCYCLLRGYADEHPAPSGPAIYLSNLKTWHYILKDVLFVTQQTLGSAAVIYHTWVLWSYNWKVIVLPIILLTMNIGMLFLHVFHAPAVACLHLLIVTGSLICAKYSDIEVFSVLSSRLITTYYSVAFILSVIAVGFMSYRIWITHRNAAGYYAGQGKLISIMWILIESAALQIIAEFILLVLSFLHENSRYIDITFNSIAVRIKLQSLKEAGEQTNSANNPVQTIGSMPMHCIKIKNTKEVNDGLANSRRTSESST
ncbi:hypothetical protein BDQ17DRAFT_1263088 [Cyathus striatus]|nr:hypothetical protein BDQ17DRAFT_1263088 [Cyathus striatus]